MSASPPDDTPLSGLAAIEALMDLEKPFPLDRWHPEKRGRMDLRITADGRWIHEGREIERRKLIHLFASILRRDDEEYVLVTPVEKYAIDVEDAPFIATEVEMDGSGRDRVIGFHLNTGHHMIADADHPIFLRGPESDATPYTVVRRGLEAKLSRPAWNALANAAADEGLDPLGLWSRGQFFPLLAGA